MGVFMDTVFVGGFGVLVATGAIMLGIDRIGKSDMPERYKKVLTYLLIGGLVALTIGIFHWHSSVYMATYTSS